jgi:hypothetical protein
VVDALRGRMADLDRGFAEVGCSLACTNKWRCLQDGDVTLPRLGTCLLERHRSVGGARCCDTQAKAEEATAARDLAALKAEEAAQGGDASDLARERDECRWDDFLVLLGGAPVAAPCLAKLLRNFRPRVGLRAVPVPPLPAAC